MPADGTSAAEFGTVSGDFGTSRFTGSSQASGVLAVGANVGPTVAHSGPTTNCWPGGAASSQRAGQDAVRRKIMPLMLANDVVGPLEAGQ